MRYLTLSADYLHPTLKDDSSDQVNVEELHLPSELVIRLKEWNQSYQAIIPLEPSRRSESATEILITTLDKEGAEIAVAIAEAVSAKVRYYSEGKLTYLDQDV
jgi:hypothetical protein